MLTQETAKKPYGYQGNCHLKFGDSLHLKIKQTIKSEDEQENKKKQKKQQHKKKKHNNQKKVCINFDLYQASNFCIFFKQKSERFFSSFFSLVR